MILASIRATVVFPAPLSPTKAVTFPASSRTVTLSTACTRVLRASGLRPCLTENDLTRSRPSRTGTFTSPPREPGLDPARQAPPGLSRRLGAASRRLRAHPHQAAPCAAAPVGI